MHPLSWFVKGFYKSISSGAEPSPYVKFTFRWPQYRVWAAPLDALVDSGSPYTAIATRDAERYQIPFSKLKRDSKISSIGLGGLNVVPRLTSNAELVFTDEEAKRHQIKYEPLYILEPNFPRTLWKERGAYRLPNIIGMDLLRSQRVRVHMNPSLSEFTLEFPG